MGETRTHVLLLGRPQIILINLYAKCQKLRQVLEVGQLPEVATATNSDYATCGMKRESCRAQKNHPHSPITLAYRKCKDPNNNPFHFYVRTKLGSSEIWY